MPRISTERKRLGRQPAGLHRVAEHPPEQLEVLGEHLVLQPLEHLDRRALGHHRRAVVGVAGVAGEHELGHHQPAGDRPQLGLQHGDVAAGVDAGGGELVIRAGARVEDRAGGVAAEVAGAARGAGW